MSGLGFRPQRKRTSERFAPTWAAKFDTKLPIHVLRQAEASRSYAEAEKVVVSYYREAALLKLNEPDGTS
jgi:hypothetical protein